MHKHDLSFTLSALFLGCALGVVFLAMLLGSISLMNHHHPIAGLFLFIGAFAYALSAMAADAKVHNR